MVVCSELADHPVVRDAEQFCSDGVRGNDHRVGEYHGRTQSNKQQHCMQDAWKENREVGNRADERLNAWRARPFEKSPPRYPGNLGPDTVPSALRRQVSLPRVDGDHIQVRPLFPERQNYFAKYGRGPSAETAIVVCDHQNPGGRAPLA